MAASFTRGAPHPSLRGVVLRYEGYDEHESAPVTMRQLPASFAPIIIDLDAGWTIDHGRTNPDPITLQSFVAGIADSPVLIGHGGSARCLQLDLTPLGARRLLGVPMAELANRSVPIDDVLGKSGRQLVQRIGEAPDWTTRFALLDRTLRARLAETPEVDSGIAWSVDRLMTSGGTAPIGELASELGWSHRRLIARFRDAVGLAPKLVARVVRFERLSALMAENPTLDWTEAAIGCGYFDQAHLAREVRALTGLPPTQLRAETVNFVQDDIAFPA